MPALTSSDREFLSKVYASATLNPFSVERLSTDAAAIGLGGSIQSFSHVPDLIAKLGRRLAATLPPGGPSWRSFEAGDALLLEAGILFHVFHSHAPALDDYIHAQSESTGAPLPAEAAASVFADLRARGFTQAAAERYVAVIFQLRRAFFFISTGLLGECESMRRLRMDVWNAIFTGDLRLYLESLWNRMDDFSVLLLGETGTGKGAAAMAIGRSNYIPYNSQRRAFAENFNDAFLSINLSEFSESLIESELFGHVKGAFTGAIGNHDGIFSRCSRHGAIFLDEIGDVSEHVQIKLLQVLQQRIFSPVGGHATLRFGGRVIAATNKDLAALRADGAFRNDFYYRLSSSRITLPTLRQRIAEDRGELAFMLREIVHRIVGTPDDTLAGYIARRFAEGLPADYQWPGNVRELEQAVRSVLVSGNYGGETPQAAPGMAIPREIAEILNGEMTLDELEAWYCRHLHSRFGTYGEVARRLGVDWRTVKQKIGN